MSDCADDNRREDAGKAGEGCMKHEAVIIILGLLALLGSWWLTRTDTPPCVGMAWECRIQEKK